MLAGELSTPLKNGSFTKRKAQHKIHDLPAQNCSLGETTTQMQSARIEPIKQAAHSVNAQSIPHKSHLRQVSQLRPLPPQLIKDAAVEGLLLLTATAQLPQVRIIQTGPVLREGLGTVSLDLPTRSKYKQRFES